MDASGKAYVIEANANPQLAQEEDFAKSAKRAKVSYAMLLERIMALGVQWQPHRMGTGIGQVRAASRRGRAGRAGEALPQMVQIR